MNHLNHIQHEALRLVEWAGNPKVSGERSCPLCEVLQDEEHKKNCPIGRALGAFRSVVVAKKTVAELMSDEEQAWEEES